MQRYGDVDLVLLKGEGTTVEIVSFLLRKTTMEV
jgi:hypothetical protein